MKLFHEPLGGAHRDKDLILDSVRNSIRKNLEFFLKYEQRRDSYYKGKINFYRLVER